MITFVSLSLTLTCLLRSRPRYLHWPVGDFPRNHISSSLPHP
jgi:hypothetical protein